MEKVAGKTFKLKAKVWLYPGAAGWHFVNLDKKMSAQIRAIYPKGFVKVKVRVGKTEWNTSLFPHKESGCYLLSIKSQIRKKEDMWEGDEVSLVFQIL
jgi:Domain of unknown function (DUF1905)